MQKINPVQSGHVFTYLVKQPKKTTTAEKNKTSATLQILISHTQGTNL